MNTTETKTNFANVAVEIDITTPKALDGRNKEVKLLKQIVELKHRAEEIEKELKASKAELASLVEEGEELRYENYKASYITRNSKKLDEALVEKNHGIVITDDDYKKSESTYLDVRELKK